MNENRPTLTKTGRGVIIPVRIRRMAE